MDRILTVYYLTLKGYDTLHSEVTSCITLLWSIQQLESLDNKHSIASIICSLMKSTLYSAPHSKYSIPIISTSQVSNSESVSCSLSLGH